MLDELQVVCHSLGILFDLDFITYFKLSAFIPQHRQTNQSRNDNGNIGYACKLFEHDQHAPGRGDGKDVA